MNKELCFLIEKRQLYMEQILVEYDSIPIFYICSDTSNYYIVLRRDLEREEYIVEMISLKQISDMLQGTLSMRDIMLSSKVFWDIQAGESIEEDVVERKDIQELPLEDLPYEGSFFKIANREQEVFAMKIEQELFECDKWEEINTLSSEEIFEAFIEENVNINEVPHFHMEISNVNWVLKIPFLEHSVMNNVFVMNSSDVLYTTDISESKIVVNPEETNLVKAA